MSANNSKPKAAAVAPVIVLHEEPSDIARYFFRLAPAALVSIFFHGILICLFFAYAWVSSAADRLMTEKTGMVETKPIEETITAEEPVDEKKALSNSVDEDPAPPDTPMENITFNNERIADISVPGTVNLAQPVGIDGGSKDAMPVSLPAPGGFGSVGQGGAEAGDFKVGNSNAIGEVGGYDPKGLSLPPGSFFGRSGATKKNALMNGGGTDASEAAVARGLKWLAAHQEPDGKWMFNSQRLADRDRGSESNDIAATALGLLPLLASGKTHKPSKDNPYDKNIDKGLRFLMRSQDPKTGYFGGSMYAHGLATIAICEAYGLSQDPMLRRPAQSAINLLVNAQHEGGGWRYQPRPNPGDLSVSGWQIMALKSGQMAGLDVPAVTIRKVKKFLDGNCNEADEGYGYVGPGNSPRMTAVGLLCRQYMENWGPSHPRMIKSVNRFIKTHPPTKKDAYYYYYATQVMHHFGGEAWKTWNEQMREILISSQDKNENSPNYGSWAGNGDPYKNVGGRLLITSLNLLTLEVYYRYLPLYYRDAGYKAVEGASK
jgi:hypothetical protein